MLELNKYHFVFTFLCLFIVQSVFSQVKEKKKDSTDIVYDKIEDFSEESKTSKFLHRLIFKSNKKSKNKTKVRERQDLEPYQGKIIRKIEVDSHDPFGFSFTDSTKTTRNWLERTGNLLHIKSKDFAIKNYVIIKKNQALDVSKIKESERLIRSQKFVRDVEITVQPVEKSQDSVDVIITSLDSWSWIPKASFSGSKMKIKLTDYNYLGFGHQFDIGMQNRFSSGKIAPQFFYKLPNFKNTYISSYVAYEEDLIGNYNKRFNVDRNFFSPFTKWAAGIYVDEQYKLKFLPGMDVAVDDPQAFKYRSQDIWGGYSFHLFKGQSDRERKANIIATSRLLHVDYSEKPSAEYDKINFFTSETFYLGSIGISSRQFLEDRFIFRDGIIENVPVGDIYSITLGNQYKNQSNRFYFGAKVAHGNYYDWGYLNGSLEYGTFMKGSVPEQSAYALRINYFTNLIELGPKWRMRQFIKPQFIIGKNRLDSFGDRLTIDEVNDFGNFYGNQEGLKNSIGIPGFDSDLLGTSKYALSLQTQFYSSRELLGFRLNPYFNMNAAILAGNESYSSNKLFSSFSIGLILRNDYLVFNSVRFSLSYYPEIPAEGKNIFNTDSNYFDEGGLQGFEIGKPSPVWYN
ncbi:BamA/TamA family outer membrane protein [Psychroflexus halocasei]|uniref:Outer membrane protein assembly factor BamA n=1 Tax=Psychroflexus halocasei TaxID=908615 RepID=A0A1H3YQY5_9FLAO|nr:hypothetical protein [Psychroflexus halocasei]SEA13591.1 hypothetical protein SAMN05421540_103218 [Psychroflexus halocasei]